MLTLELTSQERMLIINALLYARDRLMLQDGFEGLVEKMAKSPCGAPGCSYCDPQPDEYEPDPRDDAAFERLREEVEMEEYEADLEECESQEYKS